MSEMQIFTSDNCLLIKYAILPVQKVDIYIFEKRLFHSTFLNKCSTPSPLWVITGTHVIINFGNCTSDHILSIYSCLHDKRNIPKAIPTRQMQNKSHATETITRLS